MRSINTLKDLLKIIKEHPEHDKLMVFFDLDLTLIWTENSDEDTLIEEKVTKELFDFLHEKQIWYTFCTARYHNVVLVQKKRDSHRKEMTENIEKLYDIFESLGIDCSQYRKKNSEMIVLKKAGKPVGILYKGILLGDKKGPIIKQFREEYNLEKSHPHVIFIDDVDRYLTSVSRHVPGSIVIRREIDEDFIGD